MVVADIDWHIQSVQLSQTASDSSSPLLHQFTIVVAFRFNQTGQEVSSKTVNDWNLILHVFLQKTINKRVIKPHSSLRHTQEVRLLYIGTSDFQNWQFIHYLIPSFILLLDHPTSLFECIRDEVVSL